MEKIYDGLQTTNINSLVSTFQDACCDQASLSKTKAYWNKMVKVFVCLDCFCIFKGWFVFICRGEDKHKTVKCIVFGRPNKTETKKNKNETKGKNPAHLDTRAESALPVNVYTTSLATQY